MPVARQNLLSCGLPKVEGDAEDGFARAHAASVGGALVVDNGDVELAHGACE